MNINDAVEINNEHPIGRIQDLYKAYLTACSNLIQQISIYLRQEGVGATVSMINDVEIEILFKSHKKYFTEMYAECNHFVREVLPELCKKFHLEIMYSLSSAEERMELDPSIRTYRYEKVILRGVKDERQ